MQSIGEFIRNRRLSLGITMSQLSDQIGTSQSALSYIENGKRMPNPDTLKRICYALKLDSDDTNKLIDIRNKLVHNYDNTYYNYLICKNVVNDKKNNSKEFILNLLPDISSTVNIEIDNTYSTNLQNLNEINNFIDKIIYDSVKTTILNNIDEIESTAKIKFLSYFKDLEKLIK